MHFEGDSNARRGLWGIKELVREKKLSEVMGEGMRMDGGKE